MCGGGYDVTLFDSESSHNFPRIPAGYGFRAGSNSVIRYLVTRVSYGKKINRSCGSSIEHPAVLVKTVMKNNEANVAQMFSMTSHSVGGIINPSSEAVIEAACLADQGIHVVHVFAKVTGYETAVAAWKIDRSAGTWREVASKERHEHLQRPFLHGL